MNTETLNTAPYFPPFEDYLACALWSSVHFAGEDDDGTPFDEVDAELAPEARAAMEAELQDFADLLEREGIDEIPLSDEQIAHDFWLTRNGHGAGFWDRGIGEIGDTLTTWAKSFGSCDLYLGDDGLIYIS